MTLLSILRNYSAEDWQNFFITGAAVIVAVAILYFSYFRKKEREINSKKESNDD